MSLWTLYFRIVEVKQLNSYMVLWMCEWQIKLCNNKIGLVQKIKLYMHLNVFVRIDEREVENNVSLNHAIRIDNMKLHRSIYLL